MAWAKIYLKKLGSCSQGPEIVHPGIPIDRCRLSKSSLHFTLWHASYYAVDIQGSRCEVDPETGDETQDYGEPRFGFKTLRTKHFCHHDRQFTVESSTTSNLAPRLAVLIPSQMSLTFCG